MSPTRKKNTPKTPHSQRASFNEADRERAFRLYMGGTSFKEIAKSMGCSLFTIQSWHKNRNWKHRKDELESHIKNNLHSEEVMRRLEGTVIARAQQDLYSRLLDRARGLAETAENLDELKKALALTTELLTVGERIYGELDRHPATPNASPGAPAVSKSMHTGNERQVRDQLSSMDLTPPRTPPIQSNAGDGVVAPAHQAATTPPATQAQASPAPAPGPAIAASPPIPTPSPPPAPATHAQFQPVSPDALFLEDMTPEEIKAREDAKLILEQRSTLPPGHPHRVSPPQ